VGYQARRPSLIGAEEAGDSAAADKLFGTLYSELHRLAKRELGWWGSGKPESNSPLSQGVGIGVPASEEMAVVEQTVEHESSVCCRADLQV